MCGGGGGGVLAGEEVLFMANWLRVGFQFPSLLPKGDCPGPVMQLR